MSNQLLLPYDVEEVSDGYHTFKELYEHRCLLFICFLNNLTDKTFKTRLNDLKESIDGWFIAGVNTDYGQITYHLPDRYWDLLRVKEVEYNHDYDGHSSLDVLEILKKIA